jgi:hypothetical protein
MPCLCWETAEKPLKNQWHHGTAQHVRANRLTEFFSVFAYLLCSSRYPERADQKPHQRRGNLRVSPSAIKKKSSSFNPAAARAVAKSLGG